MSTLKKSLLSLLAVVMFAVIAFQPEAASAAVKKPTASSIVNQGKKYLGVRYVYGGATPKGFDCSGFTSYTFKQQGMALPRTAADQYKKGKSVSKKDLKAGDLVFFKTSSKPVSHVGIYIGSGKFIHSAGKGVAITNINDPYYWKSRYVGAKRVL
ncbi:C40 family peptidase [Lederbergia wuyishanensis]|uniref:Cell wall-associated NlpC family hydrolase n=1 Tax=Lederbergia wuyishanensis TaxID=1347903 RepID=A0ABU0D3A2_9BACI|nr:C40 family peptidase [Lederbergia wuyishanensis]MCJ8007952.1 C40 family peptidase [Lederbergia wuyishanensis]MDQ0342880.1 cell wall-associated NlpC family hydrolase [Lederbergia wuyishanensis]